MARRHQVVPNPAEHGRWEIRKTGEKRARCGTYYDVEERVFVPTPDFHMHECPNKKCGFIWAHDAAKYWRADGTRNERAHLAAHKCPKCKTEQRERYVPPALAPAAAEGKGEEIAPTF